MKPYLTQIISFYCYLIINKNQTFTQINETSPKKKKTIKKTPNWLKIFYHNPGDFPLG